MATYINFTRQCWICGEQVSLEICKIDEHGLAVHEDCCVVRLLLKHSSLRPEGNSLHIQKLVIEETAVNV